MELLCKTHAHACVLALCTDPCLHPGEHLKDRLEPRTLPSDGKPDAFGTWLALGAEWVTIAKYDDSTLV